MPDQITDQQLDLVNPMEKLKVEHLPALPTGLDLIEENGRFVLRAQSEAKGVISFSIDFSGGSFVQRFNTSIGKKQPLNKALGLDKRSDLLVVDGTAGQFRESLLIAGAGAKVIGIEKQAVLCVMAKAALQEVAQQDDPIGRASKGVRVVNSDTSVWLDSEAEKNHIDVIYLDPMFPVRQKSALVKKDMQVLQALYKQGKVQTEQALALAQKQDEQLLENAIAHTKYRVVVKRPSKAPNLTDRKPSYSVEGKSVRFDVYVKQKLI